jgi:hypothetical protein
MSERQPFAALSGLILSGFGAMLMIALSLPMVVFDPCQR